MSPAPAHFVTPSSRIADEDRVKYVVWEITLRCDLACGHCGSRAGKPRSHELSTDEALDVVAQLAAMGVEEVTLIGGEAYLREDWTVIARAIHDAGMSCTMATGGRGITPERAQQAADAKITSMSVSIDGLEATHDKQRGVRGSFASALTSLRTLRAAGLAVGANTQVNRLSLDDMEPLLDLLIAEGIHGWQVQLTVAMGRAADHPEWLLQPYDLLDVMPRLAALARRAGDHGVRFWPGNNVGYFGPFQDVFFERVLPGGYPQGCNAGRSALGLEADGSVKGCPSLPTEAYSGGTVRERSIAAIRDEHPALRFTRDRTVESLWGFCRTCYYADVCRAGCTWTAHVLFGRAGNNPFCHHRALEHQRAGLRERIVPRAPAPGLPFDHGLFDLVTEPLDAQAPPSPPPSSPKRRLPLA